LLKTDPHPGHHERPPDRSLGPIRLILVAAVVAAITALGLPARASYGARTSGDEPQYLLTASSVVNDLTLDISDELANRTYLPYHEIAVNQQSVKRGSSERQLSPHDPLLPLLIAIPMGLGGWVGAKLALVATAAATAALTAYISNRRFNTSGLVAATVTICCFGGLPLAGYGTQIYPEMAAALATVGLLALVSAPNPNPRPWTLAAMVGLVVALPWLGVKYTPIAFVGGVAMLWRWRRHRAWLTWATLGTLIGATTYLAAHQHIYGGWTVYAAGDHFGSTGEFSVIGTRVNLVGRSRRIVGLLVDRSFGIATWSPVWFLLPVAISRQLTSKVRHERFAVSIVVVTWLNASFIALTMHGWWVPGRQLVVGLPVAAIAIGQWVGSSVRRLRLVAALGLLGVINWLWLAIESSTGHRTLIVDFAETAALPYRLLAPIVPDGIAGGPTNSVLLAVWTVILVGSSLPVAQVAKRARIKR